MSSFMVSDQCINRVLTWLTKPANHRELEMVIRCLELDTGELIGQKMKEMNQAALTARYGGNNDEKYKGFKPEQVSDVEVLKGLACFLYQCSEGDVPELPLYLALTEIKGIIAFEIVQETSEYDNAKWG